MGKDPRIHINSRLLSVVHFKNKSNLKEKNMSINLEKVVLNDSTRELFDVAIRSGAQKVLDELDTLSYMIYLDRYDRCGEGSGFPVEVCRQNVQRSDTWYIQAGLTDAVVTKWLRQYPEAKQQELQNKAKQFMDYAQLLIRKK